MATIDERDEPVYVISVAAELADMHPQTLRGYERKGLITPQRTGGNTRRYSRRDVERLRLIQHLTQNEGLNLAGVQMALDLAEQLEAARRRNAELERVIEDLVRRLRDDVAEAHQSHKFELVPVAGAQVEPHPARRRHGRRPTER